MASPTPKQLSYLRYLCRKASKVFEIPENSHHASLIISQLLRGESGETRTETDILTAAIWKPGEEEQAERELCGFDNFGDLIKPFHCRQENHLHPENVLKYEVHELASELPQPGRPILLSEEPSETRSSRTGHPELNNPDTQPQRSFLLENS